MARMKAGTDATACPGARARAATVAAPTATPDANSATNPNLKPRALPNAPVPGPRLTPRRCSVPPHAPRGASESGLRTSGDVHEHCGLLRRA
eukprot:129347-Chlamydomonas_euryale.AAC.1